MKRNEVEKREKVIKIRTTADEYNRLMLRKNQSTLAGWMREFCLNQKRTYDEKVILELDPITRRNLGGISTNINQMAKYINSGKYRPTDTVRIINDLVLCRHVLERIEKEIIYYQS